MSVESTNGNVDALHRKWEELQKALEVKYAPSESRGYSARSMVIDDHILVFQQRPFDRVMGRALPTLTIYWGKDAIQKPDLVRYQTLNKLFRREVLADLLDKIEVAYQCDQHGRLGHDDDLQRDRHLPDHRRHGDDLCRRHGHEPDQLGLGRGDELSRARRLRR